MFQQKTAAPPADENGQIIAVPEELQQLGAELMHTVLQSACRVFRAEAEKVKAGYARHEIELVKNHEHVLDEVDRLRKEIATLKMTIETLQRENKVVSGDLDRKTGELQTVQGQILQKEDKLITCEQEVKRLIEELAGMRQKAENLQKHQEEITHQAKEEQIELREVRLDLAGNIETRERLDAQIKMMAEEAEKMREHLKKEHARAAVTEALIEEVRTASNKMEAEIKALKAEIHEQRETRESENKTHAEMERKMAMLMGQLEAQERTHRDATTRLEQDLSVSRSEAMSLRNRMVKAEGAYERERKAVERLESKLAGGMGGKRN
ncbi:MAG: hypothetical protein GY862_15510 [Gammaproteobacteria bacterium]|nr:hypothetical protein [Gammaproteobacteria bacterium]